MKENRELLLHQRITVDLKAQIQNGIIPAGEKLPSLRGVGRSYGVSVSTVLQAYYNLEKDGLISARPRSGYFVTPLSGDMPLLPAVTAPVQGLDWSETETLIARVFADLGTEDRVAFSLGVPDPRLLPISKLNKALVEAMRSSPNSGTSYEPVRGNQRLRRQIARRSYAWGGNLDENDIVTTAGCMEALSLSLQTVASKGDTVAVESPVYFGTLQLAKSLGLTVLELPTHPVTGIDVDILRGYVVAGKIDVCIFTTNFSNPLGGTIPTDRKREIVLLLEEYDVPLIEDDLYGDIYFGDQRPLSCKTFDKSGNVLWCSSVSKTLAPGYRVGWVAPGKYRDALLRKKMYHHICSPSLTHATVGRFLEAGKYDIHLRTLRAALSSNVIHYTRTIVESFPEGTKVTRPEGGFLLWVELPVSVCTVHLYESARKYGISISPGPMFTLADQYANCFRLSFGLVWDETTEAALRKVGELACRTVNSR